MGGLLIIPNLIMFAVVIIFLRYFIWDNYDTRKSLVVACAGMVFANFWILIVFIIAAVTVDTINPNILLGLVPGYGFSMLLWVYYRIICKEWVNMGASSS